MPTLAATDIDLSDVVLVLAAVALVIFIAERVIRR